ncbi:MAG: ankyrin repeat domain-containing protein [Gammaproteobacteria bacterium]|nr:ankyrin repeat domain-containing protein [Gammaproteobacteria bacterium]
MPFRGLEASAIADAAEQADREAVRTLLRAGEDVNARQGDGMSALHWAAEQGDHELADMLLYAGANVDGGTRIGGYTPLHIASRQGHPAVVAALLAANADVSARTTVSGATPLHLAASSHGPLVVRILIEAGAEVDAREAAWGQTPLIFAASAGRLEIAKILLQAGADHGISANVVDTAEMEQADQAANQRLVALLGEFKVKAGGGTDWKPRPNEVQGAIDFSREIQRKWPDVPDPACEIDTDAAASRFSRSALPDRCKQHDETREETSTEEVSDEPRRRSYGEWVGHWGGLTPLLHAVRQGHADMVTLLLDAGADINQASAGDRTSPLLMASINGQFDIVLTLLDRGADPDQYSDAGTSPLFAVLERQWAPWSHYAHPVDYQRQDATHLDVLSALLEAGADPNVRLQKHLWYAEFTTAVLIPAGLHYDGATPFWRAAQALDVNAMRLLKAHGARTDIPTWKIPERRRSRRDPEAESMEEETDPSGLPPIEVGGPYVYPIHAAAGAGYGQYFMAHAHRHVTDNWLNAVRFLIEECGAELNLRDGNGYTALHHAAARGDNELIHYLVEKGADVTAVSRKGQTTADMANGPTQRVSPFPDTIALLESLGAKNNHHCVSC